MKLTKQTKQQTFCLGETHPSPGSPARGLGLQRCPAELALQAPGVQSINRYLQTFRAKDVKPEIKRAEGVGGAIFILLFFCQEDEVLS